MFNRVLNTMENGVRYVRTHPQLLFTLMLIVVIPTAFIVNGQQFLEAARSNQERLEKDRIGLLHDMFGAFMRGTAFDVPTIQDELSQIVAINPDITKFHILKEEGETMHIIASMNADMIGTVPDDVRPYRLAHATPDDSFITPYADYGIRYWQSFRLVRAQNGDAYYIFTETSLEHIDSLFAANIMKAYYWLIGIVLVILVLLARHVRLIDYAYLYQETKKANDMKDLYTNMIAHELRAPLTAMRGYASLIRERTGLPEDVHKHASRIEEASGRLVAIVNDLLDVARIQAGQMSIVKEPVNIAETVTSVVEALRVSAHEKHIEIHAENVHTDVTVLGDSKRLHQALTNLVSNAIKYTKEGTITVALEDRNDRVELRVKDTGMGISAENQKKLFAPFFRVESSDVSAITGTGLGMWITKQLIELMGGSIGIESIKGVGTHVVVVFPKKR